MMVGEKVEQPKLAQHDSSVLDLVFVMDCTGSMGPYINSATEVIINLYGFNWTITNFILYFIQT